MAQQEATHWWYAARRNLLRDALGKLLPADREHCILDLASACGGNFEPCASRGRVVGIDLSPVAMSYCAQRSAASLVQGDVQVLPFGDRVFDAVVAFDVFEHLPDDVAAMREAARVLRPESVLLVNVPACQALFSEHDVAFEHHRRYSRRELRDKLRTAGFEVMQISYWSFFLFPAVFAARKAARLLARKDRTATSDFHKPIPRPATWLFTQLSRFEVGHMQRGGSFPFGVSLYAICRKLPAAVPERTREEATIRAEVPHNGTRRPARACPCEEAEAMAQEREPATAAAR
jgi:SAM-dependent methyltransferase